MRIRTVLTERAIEGAIGSSPMASGKEFTDRLFGLRKRAATGEHEFDTLCTTLEIEHRLTPPKSPQTNGMVERFNGRIEEVLQSHHFRSGEEVETTLHRYVWLYNQQIPQSALSSKTPLQAMKNWNKLRPELFKKLPYHLTGCDMHALGRCHDLSRNLIRIWIEKAEAGGLDEDAAAAELLTDYEARIAALERLVGRQALEIELSQRGVNAPNPRREARLHP